MIEYIEKLSNEQIICFANSITGRKNYVPKIKKELNSIALYYIDYNGGHYDSVQRVIFTDFSVKIDHEELDIKACACWVHYVHKNLQEQYKNAYAKKWNNFSKDKLEECDFIIAQKENYILPEDETSLTK